MFASPRRKGAARRLFLSHISGLDWLIALEFGRVDDGQPSENWRGVCDEVGFLCDGPDGEELGFKVVGFSELDVDAAENAGIWEGPRFDVPVLGVSGVTAGEIIVAARALFGGADSVNRLYFGAATRASGEEALGYWLACLQSGDSMAHFGLGYTLYELGRLPEAYRHLRHYTEISPHGSWNWRWFCVAAAAMGLPGEARAAYEHAWALEGDGAEETDARELLDELDD